MFVVHAWLAAGLVNISRYIFDCWAVCNSGSIINLSVFMLWLNNNKHEILVLHGFERKSGSQTSLKTEPEIVVLFVVKASINLMVCISVFARHCTGCKAAPQR